MIKNEWIIKVIEKLEQDMFYGKITINFCGGEIPNIHKEESIQKPKDSSLKS